MIKKIGIVTAIAVLGLTTSTCMEKVPAGNVGVKVNLYGGEKGVKPQTVGPGRYWLTWNEEIYKFPTFVQTVTWGGPDEATGSPDNRLVFQDSQGLKIIAPIGLTYAVDPNKASTLFQKYRKGVDEITGVFLKTIIRDALVNEASQMMVDDIYGRQKEALINRVTERVRSRVAVDGIIIDRITWAGDMELPQTVVHALNNKIKATQIAQQRENELRATEAEAAKNIAQAKGDAEAILTKAKAEADANREIAASLSPTLVEYEKVKKWNGTVPSVTGGATPILDLRN